MELLKKYLSNQISLPDFLKEVNGKSFVSEETTINFIISGLEKAINIYNHIEINYIQYSYKNHGQYIQCDIVYYNRKKQYDTSAEKN